MPHSPRNKPSLNKLAEYAAIDLKRVPRGSADELEILRRLVKTTVAIVRDLDRATRDEG